MPPILFASFLRLCMPRWKQVSHCLALLLPRYWDTSMVSMGQHSWAFSLTSLFWTQICPPRCSSSSTHSRTHQSSDWRVSLPSQSSSRGSPHWTLLRALSPLPSPCRDSHSLTNEGPIPGTCFSAWDIQLAIVVLWQVLQVWKVRRCRSQIGRLPLWS